MKKGGLEDWSDFLSPWAKFEALVCRVQFSAAWELDAAVLDHTGTAARGQRGHGATLDEHEQTRHVGGHAQAVALPLPCLSVSMSSGVPLHVLL